PRPTPSPPRSHTSSQSSASGPSHSTGVDEMPVGHHRIHCARYRGSRIGLEVIVGVQFWWIYGARNRLDHLFAQEAGDLLAKLPHDLDAAGRLTATVLEELGVPPLASRGTSEPR